MAESVDLGALTSRQLAALVREGRGALAAAPERSDRFHGFQVTWEDNHFVVHKRSTTPEGVLVETREDYATIKPAMGSAWKWTHTFFPPGARGRGVVTNPPGSRSTPQAT